MRLITPLLVYWMCVHSVMPLKDNSLWVTGVPTGLFTATLYYVVLAALSQDILSVLGSPRLPSKHRLFHTGEDSSPQPCIATFGHRSQTHPIPLVVLCFPPPPLPKAISHFSSSTFTPSHLGYCPSISPFMLLTLLLHNVVFLVWKGQRARLRETC